MKLKKYFYIQTIIMIFFSMSAFAIVQPQPPLPPGSPNSKKFWNVSQEQYDADSAAFMQNSDRYRYFADTITGIEVLSATNTKSYNITPHYDLTSDELGLLDKIVLLKHLDKSDKEIYAIRKMDRFLSTNFKTQILPSDIYNHSNLPKPFYLTDLRNWSFNAIENDDLDLLRALLDNYNLLNIRNKNGYGLLSYAALHNKIDIVRFLIKRGANVSETNSYKETPLMIAIKNNNTAIVKVLDRTGCKLQNKNKLLNDILQ